MFCQCCLLRGPRAPIEPDNEFWLAPAEEEARRLWNEAAKAAEPKQA